MTDKQTQADYEGRRNAALKNLDAKHLLNVALALNARSEMFGKVGESAFHNFGYLPAISGELKATSPEGNSFGVVSNALIGSRGEDGEFYSGHVTEQEIIQQASAIIQGSLNDVKVSDILERVDYWGALPEEVKDVYMSDLKESNKELYSDLISTYMSYHTSIEVGKSLQTQAKGLVGGLEKKLNPQDSE